MDRIKLDMAVIVEGKYDKIKLGSILDAVIITTDGFSIYKDREKLALIRKYARKSGVVILTDSDAAGFQIRNHLKGSITDGRLINIYVPDILGKEKRKDKPSKEGKLGVEGIDKQILLEAFKKAGLLEEGGERGTWASVQTLMDDGLSGGENSSKKRRELCIALSLPERLSAKGLLQALNTLYTREEYEKALKKIGSVRTAG